MGQGASAGGDACHGRRPYRSRRKVAASTMSGSDRTDGVESLPDGLDSVATFRPYRRVRCAAADRREMIAKLAGGNVPRAMEGASAPPRGWPLRDRDDSMLDGK